MVTSDRVRPETKYEDGAPMSRAAKAERGSANQLTSKRLQAMGPGALGGLPT